MINKQFNLIDEHMNQCMEVFNENDFAVEEQEEREKSCSKRVAYVMTELHEFLKRVFQRLPAQSLLKCSRVCKRWKSVAAFILKSRETLTWAQYNYHIHHVTSPIVDSSLGFFGIDLNTCLQEAWSVPSCCLIFSEFQNVSEFDGSSYEALEYEDPHSSDSVKRCIKTVLPPSCDIVAVAVPGTVCTTRNLASSAESEGEGGVVAVLFPKMEGVKITRASVGRHGNIWEQTGIERHQNVKCILTLTTKIGSNLESAGEKLQEAFFKDGQTPVIAGAIVDKSLSDKKSATECIIFSGERVSAASVLLGGDADNEERVIKELRLLKSCGLSEQNSIGLMFACIGRGSEFFKEWDVESKAFRTVFPKTPLFGVFGNGEFGCTNLPKSKWKKVPKMAHGYTTIMCLISFG